MKKRDLRLELLAAERAAVNKKRKAEGKPPLPDEDAAKPVAAIEAAKEDEESNKRRRLLQEALELDKDDDSDEEMDSEKKQDKGKGKEKMDVDGEESGSEEVSQFWRAVISLLTWFPSPQSRTIACSHSLVIPASFDRAQASRSNVREWAGCGGWPRSGSVAGAAGCRHGRWVAEMDGGD